MAIEGPIEELSLADLLQLLSLTAKTGTLTVTGRGGEEIAKVFLKDGSVAYAHQVGAEEIGQRLLKAGRISRERLRMAENAAKGSKTIEEVLVELNFITGSELERFARMQVEETVYDLFELGKGYFRFEEGGLPSDLRPLFSLKVESLLMEGSRRMDEWSRISQSIPSLDLVLELTHSPGKAGSLNLRPKDWTILSLVDGKRTVREVLKDVGGEFETAKQLYELVNTGVLRVAETAKKEVKDHLASGERFLKEGLYGKAAEELELALEENPEDPRILYSLGEALYKNGSYGEALSFYSLLRKVQPDRADVHYHIGFCLARIGDLKSAIREWETFLSLAPSGNLRADLQNMVRAAREFDTALEVRRDDPLAGGGSEGNGAQSDPVVRETLLFGEKLNE